MLDTIFGKNSFEVYFKILILAHVLPDITEREGLITTVRRALSSHAVSLSIESEALMCVFVFLE